MAIQRSWCVRSEMVTSEHQSYLRFWGKQRGANDGGANWHAAAYHCLDVAASARALLEANEFLRRQLAVLLAISEQQLVELMTFWMALHDARSDVLRSNMHLTAAVPPGSFCRLVR